MDAVEETIGFDKESNEDKTQNEYVRSLEKPITQWCIYHGVQGAQALPSVPSTLPLCHVLVTSYLTGLA